MAFKSSSLPVGSAAGGLDAVRAVQADCAVITGLPHIPIQCSEPVAGYETLGFATRRLGALEMRLGLTLMFLGAAFQIGGFRHKIRHHKHVASFCLCDIETAICFSQ